MRSHGGVETMLEDKKFLFGNQHPSNHMRREYLAEQFALVCDQEQFELHIKNNIMCGVLLVSTKF